jgi:nucleotide-binding universal stress UspA family protein
MANRILFPTDFSTTAQAGLADAEAIAKAQGATLLVLHVQESTTAYGDTSGCGRLEPSIELVERMLNELTLSDTTIPVVYRFSIGNPAAEIVKVANDENVNLIVMGTHGRRGLPRLLKGSIAETVVRHARCPVLTRKEPKPTAVHQIEKRAE